MKDFLSKLTLPRIILGVLACLMVAMLVERCANKKQAEKEHKIDVIEAKAETAVAIDSTATAILRPILDSLRIQHEKDGRLLLKEKLKNTEIQLKYEKLRRRNDSLNRLLPKRPTW